MDKNTNGKKIRKNYYKSPSTRGVFHLGLELPIEYKEPFKRFAKANDRTMKPHAAHIIKREIENFLSSTQRVDEPASPSVN